MSTACSWPNEETADHSEGEWCETMRLKASQRNVDWTWKEGETTFFFFGQGSDLVFFEHGYLWEEECRWGM